MEDPEEDPKDDPIEDLVDPDQIFAATTEISQNALIYGMLANDVTIGEADGVGATIPADVKIENGASSLALSVKAVETGSEITLSEGETAQSLDVHIDGIAADNTVPMIVNLGAVFAAGLGETGLKLYHVENGTPVLMTKVSGVENFAIHNQYTYNNETGEVSIYVASFSVFSAVQASVDTWDGEAVAEGFASGTGTEDDPFIIETAAQLVYFRNQVDAGVTYNDQYVKLAKDIDLADKLFDPIGFGYYDDDDTDGKTNYRVFMGTFDGAGHTIYNLYQNCWELDPDKTNYSTYTYSTAGAGLFASIKDATMKNIAISGAEIVFECVDMGVLVGYAQGTCHFENIVITNSNIANYNRYTGGVVGEVSYGPYGIDTLLGYSHTFKNVTVDSTVTVSGLWGSFGCGMGGVIGGKWGDATVMMENVVSAPVMDVYNDVTSAYQWYAFRGCGMLIGHTEEPYSDGRHSGNATASFLTCENVKVYYGDWVNYHYYEFKNQDNGTGRNYPWVRAEAGNYCDAFSNIRYGVPTHGGVKVSELTEEELKAKATNYTPIVFDQLYGADRGMYGTAEHEGVTVFKSNKKTVYIQNNLGWTNLKLHYWYKNGNDIWTNVVNGIVLTEENGVYKVELPAYACGFRISGTNSEGEYNEGTEVNLSDVIENWTYVLDGEHAHTEEITAHGYAATCTKAGLTDAKKCTVCGKVTAEQEVIPVKAHTPGAAATCTTTQTCTVCNAVLKDKLGHSYTSKVTTEATCTTAGVKTYTCSNCNHSYTESIAATGIHSYDYKVTTNPKSNATGVLTGTCSMCQGTTTVTLPELKEDTGDYTKTTTKQETCTESGEREWKWNNTSYGEVIVTVFVQAKGHGYDYKVTTRPISTSTGVLTGTCSRCSDVVTVTMPKTTETDYIRTVTKNATCTESGTVKWEWKDTTYGEVTFTHTIEMKSHSYGSWVSDGNEHWKVCENCDAEANRAAHSGGTATLTEQAKCSTCNASYGTTNQPVVNADTYIASDAQGTPYSTSSKLNANKGSYRPIIRYDLSAALNSSDFEESGAKILFTFAVVEYADKLTNSSLQFNAYAFTPGNGVSDANFANITWNNCGQGSVLYRGTANFLIKDSKLENCSDKVTISTANGITYVTYTFNYSALKAYVSTASATYGYLVMGFDFDDTVKLYSADSNYPPVVTIKNGTSNSNTFTDRQSVLLLGQSNMAGRGFAEDVNPISDDRIFMMNSSMEWVKMQEPIHFDKADAGVGLAASFAKGFVDTFDCEIGLIPAAVGSTSIGDWAVGGTFYNNAVAMAKEALKTSEICAILWHQGESNRNSHDTYAAKLQTILDALIAELGLEADKIVIITGELREISTDVDKRDSFHAQLNQLSNVYNNYGVADAEGLTLNKDIIHFDAPSQRVFGYRYFNIFKTLVTGTGYDFVDDRDYYYVGEAKDPNPSNSGFSDRPGDSNIGDASTDGGKIAIEGMVVEDTYISSESKDATHADKAYIGTNNNSRPLIMFNFSNFFSAGGFEANKSNATVEFRFAITKNASAIVSGTTATVYAFTPGSGVSDANLSTATWNNCQDGQSHAALNKGKATKIYDGKALDESWIVKTDEYITFIINYSDLEKFIYTDDEDNYGIIVMGFELSVSGVQFGSTEAASSDVPKVDFVY